MKSQKAHSQIIKRSYNNNNKYTYICENLNERFENLSAF